MKKIKVIVSIFLVHLTLNLNVFALGSGALSNESGLSTKVMSHGYAFSGIADDASAIFYNPAGLIQTNGWEVMTGASVLDLKSKHTTPAGVTDKMAGNTPVAPYFYISHSNEKWGYGIGVNSPFGLVTEWKDDSFAKYHATESKLLMYMVNPTVSYKFSDSFSVGGGVDFVNVFDVELNQKVPGAPDGQGKFTGDGTAWGYNMGLLWKPAERHSFGLSYRSQVNIPIEGETELKDVNGLFAFAIGGSSYKTNTRTEFKLPQSVLLGYGFRPNERWTIFADYEWVNWSSTEETRFDHERNNAVLTQTVSRDWKSTNNVGVGAEWKVNERVDLRFGGLVYERVVPSGTLEASLPDSSRFMLSVGPGFHFGNFSVDLGYNAIFFNDRTVDNNAGNAFASMDGKYETMINIYSLGISHKWGGSN